jgi:hypothetical protein
MGFGEALTNSVDSPVGLDILQAGALNNGIVSKPIPLH